MSSPPPPNSSPKSTPILYYGLFIITAAALILVIYNLIIVRCCTNNTLTRQPQRQTHMPEPSSSRSFDNLNIRLVNSFKYKREKENNESEYECPICLSVFEEGEEVRELARCKHYFHAPCIDRWLYSHVNCPVCRASLELPVLRTNMLSPGRLVFANMV